MVFFVIALYPLEDGGGLGDARFVDVYRLEAALERGVLLDILAVFAEGGRADDLYLAAGKGGLEDVRGVHAALALARADEVMHLVDEKNDIPLALDLVDEPLDAALELPAELRSGNQRGKVEQVNLLFAQARRDEIRVLQRVSEALGDGGLADAGFADEAGVVLYAAVEDLDGAVDLLVASDDTVDLALADALGKIDAEVIEELALLLFLGLFGALFALGFALFAIVLAVLVAGKLEEGHRRGAARLEHIAVADYLRHALVDRFHILLGHTELVDKAADIREVKLPCARNAVALVGLVAVFHLGDENDGYAFFTSAAKHFSSPVLRGLIPFRKLFSRLPPLWTRPSPLWSSPFRPPARRS